MSEKAHRLEKRGARFMDCLLLLLFSVRFEVAGKYQVHPFSVELFH